MSSKVVQDAFWDYLRLNWHKTLIHDVDNAKDKLPAGLCDWVTFQFFYAPDQQVSMGVPGDNWYMEDGGILLYVFVPTGTSTKIVKAYGQELQQLFRGKQFSGITVQGVSAPAPREQAPIQEGAWFGEALAIDYYCYKREGATST